MTAKYRLTASAKADITRVLSESAFRHGQDARNRYAALILAALKRIANAPDGHLTLDRPDLRPDIRCFHIRHSRLHSTEQPVGRPVHVVFYRSTGSGVIEVIRVLHERMDPVRHI
ncbi:type II toxin-antitoxin system RelE/ParE family toxin [Thalassospira marina]|uniref:Plasmid stablization protein n=1 Tax=Thalassospira marina TaxID=2048283 RepID=A0ABN5FB94_9PROT|nr:type II toxin-antitoxin system RelE/ParE family toxin [Thalassospira marina]AUG51543.1 plasmid stablization protein [Thalassospira marina]